MNFRPDRVSSLIEKELSRIMVREVEFEDAVVTITRVDVGSKLDIASVYVAVIPEARNGAVMRILAREQGKLHHLLSRTLNIRPMPQIRFVYDAGADNAGRIEKLMLDEHNG